MRAGQVGAHWANGSIFHAYFCPRLRGRADADTGRLPQVAANDGRTPVLDVFDYEHGRIHRGDDDGRNHFRHERHYAEQRLNGDNDVLVVVNAEASVILFASVT
ncbi:MAG: hypothetical protein JSS00_12135 [Proteobacteria bacterium]|nr:hypothetical protein [Pseudomonadota bacterium]